MIERTAIATPDGRSLDVWTAGPADGDALLFQPGTPGAGMPFGGHVEALAERGLRFVSWSRAGYGSSTRRRGRSVADNVDDARTVLDHFDVDRAYAVGWSGGGPHALATAALLPERIRSTAIIGGAAPYPAEGLDWLAGMGKENVEDFETTLAGEEAIRPIAERQAADLRTITADEVAASLGDLIDDVDRGSLTGEFSAWLADLFREALRVSVDGWIDDDLALVKPWGFDLATIAGPVHIWQGAHDRMVPFGHGAWLAKRCGGACPHLLPDQGHLTLLVDQWPRIIDELLADGR